MVRWRGGECSTLGRMEWTVTDRERPWTANAERTMHYQKRARLVREARTRWAWLAMAAGIPFMERISVVAQPLSKTRRWRPDVAACYPTVKAAIDGLVDAGVIVDDDDQHLIAVTFLPVRYGSIDGLTLTVVEE